MKIKKYDGLVCIILSLILLLFVFDIPNTAEQARIYPLVILICSYILIGIIFIRWCIELKNDAFKFCSGLSNDRVVYIIVYCAALLVYILLINQIGYILSTILFGIYSLIYMKCENKPAIIIIPIACTLLMYFIFSKFLFVNLPKGIFNY